MITPYLLCCAHYLHCVPKNVHQQLVHWPTSHVYCSHFSLGNPESHFSTVLFILYSYSDYLRLKTKCNCCTAAYLFTCCCLLLPIICVALFNGQFFYLFGQSFSEPPMPTHNRLFSKPPTFGGTQHYLQSDVKVLHFTR